MSVEPSCANHPGPAQPQTPLSVDQLSGDLLCPICGEPLDLIDNGSGLTGWCAACALETEIAL